MDTLYNGAETEKIDFRCVNREEFGEIQWDNFDGQNWEAAFKKSDIGKRA
jgi:hypothetical protein